MSLRLLFLSTTLQRIFQNSTRCYEYNFILPLNFVFEPKTYSNKKESFNDQEGIFCFECIHFAMNQHLPMQCFLDHILHLRHNQSSEYIQLAKFENVYSIYCLQVMYRIQELGICLIMPKHKLKRKLK